MCQVLQIFIRAHGGPLSRAVIIQEECPTIPVNIWTVLEIRSRSGRLPTPDRPFSVTCGVLGMSRIFDAVVAGDSDAEAVARFVKGIAINAYRFAGSPETIYLSGGLCDNQLFVKSFPCRVIPLGRFVLLEGLKKTAEKLAENGLLTETGTDIPK